MIISLIISLLLLLNGKVLKCLKSSLTTLITKTSNGKQLVGVNQWGRPITIGSILLRTISGVLTRRLVEVCKVNPRQKDFVKSSGCSENLALLDVIFQTCERNGNHSVTSSLTSPKPSTQSPTTISGRHWNGSELTRIRALPLTSD